MCVIITAATHRRKLHVHPLWPAHIHREAVVTLTVFSGRGQKLIALAVVFAAKEVLKKSSPHHVEVNRNDDSG